MINKVKNFFFVLVGFSIPLSIFFTNLSLILLLIFSILDKDYKNLNILIHKKWISSLLFLFVLYFFGLFFGEFHYDSNDLLKKLSVWLILACLFILKIKKKSYSNGIYAFLFSILIMVTFSVLNRLEIISHFYEYFPMFLKNSNNLHLYPSTHLYNYHNILISMSLIINFYIFSKVTNIFKCIITFYTLLLIYSLFSEPGKAGQLVFIIFLISFTIYSLYKSKKKTIYFSTLLLVFSLIFCNYSSIFINKYNDLKSKLSNIDKFERDRSVFWKSTIKKIALNPFYGYGTGSWRAEMNKTFSNFNSIKKEHKTPHNNFLYVFFELGILGILTLINLFYSMYKELRRKGFFKSYLVFAYATLMLFDSYMTIFIISIAFIYLFVISANYE